jgi:hypothetical protein
VHSRTLEEWRRLRVVWPGHLTTHSTEQTPYVGEKRSGREVPPGGRYYFKGRLLPTLSDGVLGVIESFLANKPSPLCEFDLHHMGGAVSEVGSSALTSPPNGG